MKESRGMKMLADQSVKAYLEVLASNAPAPGGGSASALSAAQGAALGAMVTALSLGKKKLAQYEDYLQATQESLLSHMRTLTEDIDRDAAAFDAVSAAMKLPKETEEQVSRRLAAIQSALLAATYSPLGVLKTIVAALGSVEGIVDCSNKNAASDLGSAAAMLRGAAQGVWLNILINLQSLRDEAQAGALREEGRALFDKAILVSDRIYARIEAMFCV